PGNAPASIGLARLAAERGSYDEAEALLRSAETSPTFPVRVMLAELLIRKGELRRAAAELARAEAESGVAGSPEVIAARGVLALAEGRAQDARELLDAARTRLPDRLGIALALARAQMAAG